MNYQTLDGQTKTVGEAIVATASVYPKDGQARKIYFKLGGTMGTVTYDIKADKWYGLPRVVPGIKKAFGIS